MSDNIDELSDKELHLELVKYGCNTPVLPTTRKLLVSKLRKLIKENNGASAVPQVEETTTVTTTRKRKSSMSSMPPPKIPSVQATASPARASTSRRSTLPHTHIIPVLQTVSENSSNSPEKTIVVLDETSPRRKFPGRSKLAAMELERSILETSQEATSSPSSVNLDQTISPRQKFPGRSKLAAMELERSILESSQEATSSSLDETISPRRKFPGRSKLAAMELEKSLLETSQSMTSSPKPLSPRKSYQSEIVYQSPRSQASHLSLRKSYQPEISTTTTTIERETMRLHKYPERSAMREINSVLSQSPVTVSAIGSDMARRRTISSTPTASINLSQPAVMPGRFQTISIDKYGPLPETEVGYRWIFIVEDVSSMWVELFPLKIMSSEQCARLLIDEIFLRFGTPHNIISSVGDNEFRDDIVQHLTYCISPNDCPVVPRRSRNVKNLLRVLLQDCTSSWSTHLPTYRFALNSLKCNMTNKIASVNVFGCELRTVDEANEEINEHFVAASDVAYYLQNVGDAMRDFKDMA